MDFLDNFLNTITMYRLVEYVLIFLVGVAVVLSFFNLLSFNFIAFSFTTLFFVAVCYIANIIFAYVFEATVNNESAYITALILALIVTPIINLHDIPFFGFAALLAMASKYILAIGKKHIFNPVAVSIVLTALFLGQSASWWVGTLNMLPFVLAGGLLIVKKTRRFELVLSFLVSAVLVIFAASFAKNADLLGLFKKIIVDSPILFFAFVMLTEPLTTPPKKSLQAVYGVIVGFLFAPQLHYGPVYTTPEIALVVGNVFSYFVSPKDKLILTLKEKLQIAPGIYDFIFASDKKFAFNAGQYLEWTLGYDGIDYRGNRRYFTIASAPSEQDVRLGVRFYDIPSGFKRALKAMEPGGKILASQLAGEFTLPKDVNKKLVLVASGIGITPYRSMIKSLLDKGEKRPIIILYGNKNVGDIVYKDIFDRAEQELGIKTIYALTDTSNVPANWQGVVGFFDEVKIKELVPDFREREFYISGSHTAVNGFEKALKNIGVSSIKRDFFPGLV